MNTLAIYNEFESQISEIENACNFIPDTTTTEGYDKSKRLGLDGRKVEKAVDDKRKELRKEAMATADAIHAEGQSICKRIAAAYKPHQEAYKAVDDEKKRLKAEAEALVTSQIEALKDSVVNAIGKNSEEITAIMDGLMANPMQFGNRTIEAGSVRDGAMAQLASMKSQAVTNEANAELLARQQAEFEAQQAEAKKAQDIINEANRIERERLAAEQAEIDKAAAKEAEEARIKEAEEAAKESERQRIEQERLDAEQALAAREADKKHKGGIHRAISAELMAKGLSEDHAKMAVKVMAASQFVTINY